MTTRDYVVAYQQGDDSAFEFILQHYHKNGDIPRLIAKTKRWVDEDEALSILGDIIHKVALRAPTGPDDDTTGFIVTALRQEHAHFVKKAMRRMEVTPLYAPEDLPDGEGVSPSPEDELLNAERTTMTRAALRALPDDERKVIENLYYEGRTVAETAEILGMSNIMVRRREESALKRMREALEGLA